MLNKRKTTVFVEKEITDATATPPRVFKGDIFYNNDGRGVGEYEPQTSLILPDNIMNAVVATEREAITLTWTTPVSEVPIDHYNVYLLQTDTAPASIGDMQLVKTLEPTATSVRLDGLESGKMYYVVICSVSTEEFENASLRGMVYSQIVDAYFLLLAVGENDSLPRLLNLNSDDVWRLYNSNITTLIPNGQYTVHFMTSIEGNVFISVYTPNGANVYILDFERGELIKTSYNYSGTGAINKICKVGERYFVINQNPYNGSTYYCVGIPGPNSTWVTLESDNSTQSIDGNGNVLVISRNDGNYTVYDFSEESTQQYHIKEPAQGELKNVVYGDGIYLFMSRESNYYPFYVIEENIKKENVGVHIPMNETWGITFIPEIIYSKEKKTFFAAVGEFGTICSYRRDQDMWESHGYTEMHTSSLAYGNGKLLAVSPLHDPKYCIDGKNWISMKLEGPYDVSSLVCNRFS